MEMFVRYEELDQETQARIGQLGHVSITPDAKQSLDDADQDLTALFLLYANSQYGQIEYQAMWDNDVAMYNKFGICRAVYTLTTGKRVIVRTTWNNPVTEILDYEEEP